MFKIRCQEIDHFWWFSFIKSRVSLTDEETISQVTNKEDEYSEEEEEERTKVSIPSNEEFNKAIETVKRFLRAQVQDYYIQLQLFNISKLEETVKANRKKPQTNLTYYFKH